jgi:hypothetical protein
VFKVGPKQPDLGPRNNGVELGAPHPPVFVSIAYKEVRSLVSLLESTLAGVPVCVDFKWVNEHLLRREYPCAKVGGAYESRIVAAVTVLRGAPP